MDVTAQMCMKLHRSLLLPAEPFPINTLHGIISIQNLAVTETDFSNLGRKTEALSNKSLVFYTS